MSDLLVAMLQPRRGRVEKFGGASGALAVERIEPVGGV